MALSDCIKCWDTPCTCGYMGYTLVWHGPGRGESGGQLEVAQQHLQQERALNEKLCAQVNDLQYKLSRESADKRSAYHAMELLAASLESMCEAAFETLTCEQYAALKDEYVRIDAKKQPTTDFGVEGKSKL